MKALLIPVDHNPQLIDMSRRHLIEEARTLLDGWIELIHRPGMVFLVDEEGKPKSLESNLNASWLAGVPLVGPVIGVGWSRATWADWPQWPLQVPLYNPREQ